MKTLQLHDEARRPSYYGASSRHAVARLQEICRAGFASRGTAVVRAGGGTLSGPFRDPRSLGSRS